MDVETPLIEFPIEFAGGIAERREAAVFIDRPTPNMEFEVGIAPPIRVGIGAELDMPVLIPVLIPDMAFEFIVFIPELVDIAVFIELEAIIVEGTVVTGAIRGVAAFKPTPVPRSPDDAPKVTPPSNPLWAGIGWKKAWGAGG